MHACYSSLMATTKRTITATAPDGTEVSVNVGPKREVGAIRVTDLFGELLVTVHKTLPNAITGPNQTPIWNSCRRWAIEIGADDRPVGRWLPASK
jgi:hypothetical protein